MVWGLIESFLGNQQREHGFEARVSPISGEVTDYETLTIDYNSVKNEVIASLDENPQYNLEILNEETEDGVKKTTVRAQGLELEMSYVDMSTYLTWDEGNSFHRGEAPYTESVNISMSSEDLDPLKRVEGLLENSDDYEVSFPVNR